MENRTIAEQLQRGLDELGLALSDRQKEQLLDYLELLRKWNKAFNLSGVKDPSAMLSRHLLDSLTLVPYMKGQRILDVGTGPGLPGIPLAICFPEKDFVLLDSNGKKTRFVFQAKVQLGLQNVDVQNQRLELYESSAPIDIIVCRAFSSLTDLVSMTHHLCNRTAGEEPVTIVAMKGQYPAEDLAALPDNVVMISANNVSVPGYTGERHIIELKASGLTPIE
ncbi:MAG: 16S rRNA (guanine(527)-N(7))-methyltransferase RsmG [Gammaproteobacteria bacterium]|nr:16S rRNA (guanine(527)-N(7))-methyltransferase RsmG [Gammaproteobacteria bacterium]MDP2139664.1 16S rRNA (guanine(527)-N(7))-methyltransferase RsmG [Gammaproteobacteria bacterium]MDP2348868.1 16S rRNA (guanine(527)-N(7))-methyltransferase RsmG [Gammaproteobacteria bacterium]